MTTAVAEREVQALERLNLDDLRAEWRSRYGSPPPLRSAELLRLILAWRMQAAAFGGLDRDVKRQLQRSGAVQAEGLDLGVGAKLRREWQGSFVEVEVTAIGFLWEGHTYRSLSAAATAIAGVRWNGPRFFGLRDTQS